MSLRHHTAAFATAFLLGLVVGFVFGWVMYGVYNP